MPKRPSFQFYPGDWMKDPALSMCSPATRGIWVDLLCAVHELGHGGQVTGSASQLARACRCSVAEFVDAVDELRSTNAANVSTREQDGRTIYTIVSRRMKRDEAERKSGAQRQKRHRSKSNGRSNGARNAKVTPPSSPSSSTSVGVRHGERDPPSGTPPDAADADGERVSQPTGPPDWKSRAWNALDDWRGQPCSEYDAAMIDVIAEDISGAQGLRTLGMEPAELVCRAIEHVHEQERAFSGKKAAQNLIRSIVDRCIRDGLPPGEMPGRRQKEPAKPKERTLSEDDVDYGD